LFVGLCLGATIWGCAADVIGRRPAFNLTLFICGAFGLATAGSPTWIGYVHSIFPVRGMGRSLTLIYLELSVCALFACLGLGVGGNLPVDGALFLEFLPFASGNLLTMLSVWWPVGQVIARLVLTELRVM
jgi:MFS family permease